MEKSKISVQFNFIHVAPNHDKFPQVTDPSSVLFTSLNKSARFLFKPTRVFECLHLDPRHTPEHNNLWMIVIQNPQEKSIFYVFLYAFLIVFKYYS